MFLYGWGALVLCLIVVGAILGAVVYYLIAAYFLFVAFILQCFDRFKDRGKEDNDDDHRLRPA
jgi:uncharacterized protein involved in cysteine biosynthesis